MIVLFYCYPVMGIANNNLHVEPPHLPHPPSLISLHVQPWTGFKTIKQPELKSGTGRGCSGCDRFFSLQILQKSLHVEQCWACRGELTGLGRGKNISYNSSNDSLITYAVILDLSNKRTWPITFPITEQWLRSSSKIYGIGSKDRCFKMKKNGPEAWWEQVWLP